MPAAISIRDDFSASELRKLAARASDAELNPVENVRQYLRQNWLSNRVFDTFDDIIEAGCDAWNRLIDEPETIMSSGI